MTSNYNEDPYFGLMRAAMDILTPPVINSSDCAARLRIEPESFLRSCRQQYGSVFTLVLDKEIRITYVTDPHLFQSLLTAETS